jgi:hypothetical protein
VPLTFNQVQIRDYIEQVFNESGVIPANQRIADTLGLSNNVVNQAFNSDEFLQSLQARGIEPTRSTDLLSTEQLAGLSVFFDTKDGRSLKKKLSDCGISTAQWEAWKKQPYFAAHLRARAENSLVSNLAETEVALMDSAHRGDFNAMKLHLEIAGRWSSKTAGELNVEFLMMRILEVIQFRLAAQPDLLLLIANDLSNLTPNSDPAQSNVRQLAGSFTDPPVGGFSL